ncbi:hypothetical protein GPX89_29470 [Nocardia sp. ET3-3]|uniref:Uncharacterized protein n=1 Tax=Nocardia terrae TaxID=2675851 RepID=A0A7K1V3Z3_9NOCA|nr:hypothetical protein [Nocardia terrae]MVU81360.1 hypothetical protein [Nocardia terrae]
MAAGSAYSLRQIAHTSSGKTRIDSMFSDIEEPQPIWGCCGELASDEIVMDTRSSWRSAARSASMAP